VSDQPVEAEAGEKPAGTEPAAPQTTKDRADAPGWALRLVASVFGLYKSHFFNKRVGDIDLEDTAATWNNELKTESLRRDRADAIGRAYSGAFDRGVRLEAKAVGYLQVLAIAFAIVTLGIVRDSIVVRVVLGTSLLFLTIAVLGTVAVVQPGARRQALVWDATSPTNGLAEAAIAAADMDRRHIRSANSLAGATHDLLVGGALAVVALILIAAGFGD
jgi:hypothetical protein